MQQKGKILLSSLIVVSLSYNCLVTAVIIKKGMDCRDIA